MCSNALMLVLHLGLRLHLLYTYAKGLYLSRVSLKSMPVTVWHVMFILINTLACMTSGAFFCQVSVFTALAATLYIMSTTENPYKLFLDPDTLNQLVNQLV